MNDNSDFTALQKKLSYQFSTPELLLSALTHKSALSKKRTIDYERLEFLGDAVLDLVISDMLIRAHPEYREGELSKSRAALVNTESLADIANELELSSHVIVSKSEQVHDGHKREALLADVVESIIGAIYLDSNFESVKTVISILFKSQVESVVPSDPKTDLQEIAHVLGFNPPVYELNGTTGPEHNLLFQSTVTIGESVYGPGEGKTKKASQQAAARLALESLQEKTEDEINELLAG